VFLRIELPLELRPILAAIALAFARVLAELAAAFWIADRHP
jgi:ABC-type sulfate transport system permease component